MEAREYYNKRLKEDSTIGTIKLMEEYAKIQGKKYLENAGKLLYKEVADSYNSRCVIHDYRNSLK